MGLDIGPPFVEVHSENENEKALKILNCKKNNKLIKFCIAIHVKISLRKYPAH